MVSISLYNNKQYANILPLPSVSGLCEGQARPGLYEMDFREKRHNINMYFENIASNYSTYSNSDSNNFLFINIFQLNKCNKIKTSLKEDFFKDTFSDTIDWNLSYCQSPGRSDNTFEIKCLYSAMWWAFLIFYLFWNCVNRCNSN